jgi:DNA polymerase-3 subunit alpha
MQWVSRECKCRYQKLGDLYAKLFGVPFDGAHNALHDVRATAKIFFELKCHKVATC